METNQQLDANPYLTVKDIVKLTGISASTIYLLCNAGSIPHYTFGSQKRFRREEIQVWIKQNHRGTTAQGESHEQAR
jgi:excisionase family DNA binding protein